MTRSSTPKARLAPALVPVLLLLAACGGTTVLEGAPSICDSGSLDASTAEPAVDAPASDTATEVAPAQVDAARDVAPVKSDAAPDVASPQSDAALDVAAPQSDAALDVAAPQSDAASWCRDGVKSGDETDLDCGGSCPPCGIGQACHVNGDCGRSPGCSSNNGCACDALSMTCVFDHCFDHKKDGNETDIDCGDPLATCQGCAVGLACQLDDDCASRACDATSSLCVQAQCLDHRRDGLETDADCGGGICPKCALGQRCSLNSDCTTAACDLVSLVCVADLCFDHRQDGTETDADCGGSVCVPRCDVRQHCLANTDCFSGHVCNASRVCQ